MMGDERAERENLAVLLALFPAAGLALFVVRRRKLNRWHLAGLAIVATVFLMGPYQARTRRGPLQEALRSTIMWTT